MRLVAVALLSSLATRASAQPAPAPAEGVAPPVVDESKKAESRAHFEKGLALLKEEAWTPALAEFLASRELYPTRAATNNAAIALRKLQRYDESLDMFESFLRDFPNMPAGERTLAQRAVAELRDLVGTVDLAGAEPGAAIVIDGQPRGEYPPMAPLRVSAGTHLVRVFKEGFEPFESRADVAGGQVARVAVKLRPLTSSGSLKVTERSGRALDVLVDNVVVGVTPWEGKLSVGDHTVLLRGKGRAGTQPVSAPVKALELTNLTLVAEELDAALRIDPTPPGATVAIDSVQVGRGIWLGWLKSGPHKIEVSSEGFLPVSREIKLTRGGRELVTVSLDRDPNSALWRKPGKWEFDATAGFAVIPSFGGDVAGRCTGSCSGGLGLGGLGMFNAGYQLGSGIGFGVALGYLGAGQSLTGRSATLVPFDKNGKPGPQSGTADDSLRLSAFLGGASIFYHLGEQFPVLFRLGLGAMIGQVRDERSGSFKDSSGARYKAFSVVDFERATYFYLDPEIRFGVRLGKNIDLSAGAQVLMLLAMEQPSWNQKIQVNAGKDGVGTYKPDALMGAFVFGILPSVNLRYDF